MNDETVCKSEDGERGIWSLPQIGTLGKYFLPRLWNLYFISVFYLGSRECALVNLDEGTSVSVQPFFLTRGEVNIKH